MRIKTNNVLLEWKDPKIKKDLLNWIRADKSAMQYLSDSGVYDNQFVSWYSDMVDKKSIPDSFSYLKDVQKIISKNNTQFKPKDIVMLVLKIRDDQLRKKMFSDEHKAVAERGSKVIYEDANWIVRKIMTYDASCFYGRNTRWCIAGSKSWQNEEGIIVNGRYYWDLHMGWGSILYFVESKNITITYQTVTSESKDKTDVKTITAKLKVAVEIRPSSEVVVDNKKYKKVRFYFYDVTDKPSTTPPNITGFPDIYQIAVDNGDIESVDAVSVNSDVYPHIYLEDLDDAGIRIEKCAFLDYDRAKALPKDILARGYNYLLDAAAFDALGIGTYANDKADASREAEENRIKKDINNSQDPYEKPSDDTELPVVKEDWTGKIDNMVSGDVYIVSKDGYVGGMINSLANDKQNYRTAIYTTGGLLTKLKNPKTGEKFNQYDIVEFIGEEWYIIDDYVLYQYDIVHFQRAALGIARSLAAPDVKATPELAREQLHQSNIWKNMEQRYKLGLANFGHRPPEDNGENGDIIYVVPANESLKNSDQALLTEGYINLDTPRFYDKKTNTLLIVDIDKKIYKTVKGTPKRLETKYNAVDDSAITTIAYILRNAGYDRKKVEEVDEKLKESIKMRVREINESYADLDKSGAKEYKGETVYRITSLIPVEDRIQMYVVGLGERDPDKINYFTPVIRSARYTTEESFLFLSEEKAYEFLRAFRKDNDETEFNLKDFRVTEYHPFHEITKIIPIDSPLGRAFVGEQKVDKKKYEG